MNEGTKVDLSGAAEAVKEMKKENTKLKKECFELKKINNNMNKDINEVFDFLDSFLEFDFLFAMD